MKRTEKLVPIMTMTQNRRQKVINRGLYICAGGLYVQIRQKFH